MNPSHLVTALTAIGLIVGSAMPVQAQSADRAAVDLFYSRFLNAADPEDKTSLGERIMAETFESVGDYSGQTKSRADLIRQLDMMKGLVPDLAWTMEEVIEAGGRFVVRGRATGTPKGPLFGVDGMGRGFTMMTIDIHTVQNGRIVRAHHVEDWAGALRQLSGR